MKRLIFGISGLAALVVILLALEPPRSEDAALERVERLARNTARDGHWPSISVAFVAPGEIIWAESFGAADIASGRAMTPQTPMPIGSISKVIVGLTAAVEADAGRFDLDAPLKAAWPDAPDTVAALTFRQLANHKSGLRDSVSGYDGAAYAQNTLTHPTPLKDFLESYLSPEGGLFESGTVGVTPPGAAYAYSNVGAALAALALAEGADTPFRSLSRARAGAPGSERRALGCRGSAAKHARDAL